MPNIAIAGCVHGCLHRIYDDIIEHETKNKQTIDLVLICGDFQSVRNVNDLKCLHVPKKYRQLGDFHEYYSGTRKAPKLTIFIGGNHEASNYLMTLPYGGWVAPNIYYMGYSSVIQVAGLRIGGISGIFKGYSTNLGHFERLPFDEGTITSVYHTRHFESYRLSLINDNIPHQPLDIMMSHDWPRQISSYGNQRQLLNRKPFFRKDIDEGRLGSPLFPPLLGKLKPRYWLSAHLHVYFTAEVKHSPSAGTKFLALDKCLPRRNYLQFLSIDPQEGTSFSSNLSHDPEWLAILQKTNRFLSVEQRPPFTVPPLHPAADPVSQDEIEKAVEAFDHKLIIDEEFQLAEPVVKDPETGQMIDRDPERRINYCNRQSVSFSRKLNITDPMSVIIASTKPQANPDQISLDDLEDSRDGDTAQCSSHDEPEGNPKKLKTDPV